MAAALGTPALRAQHQQLYAGMLQHCAGGHAAVGSELALDAEALPVLRAAFSDFASAQQLSEIVLTHLRQEQRLTAEAEVYQARASACLGRAPASAPLTAAVLFVGHQLRHPGARLPYVMDALRDQLGLRIAVTASAISLQPA
jgi:hypothetical protein